MGDEALPGWIPTGLCDIMAHPHLMASSTSRSGPLPFLFPLPGYISKIYLYLLQISAQLSKVFSGC